MLKKLSVAAMVAAMSVATVPAMVVVAHAQGGANEPPTAPDPSDAAMSKDSMSKDSMSKGSMSSSKSMMKKKHMKKHMMKKHM